MTVLLAQVRNYEVYRLLEDALKALLTSLPLVQVRACVCDGLPCTAASSLTGLGPGSSVRTPAPAAQPA
jgi:hypothetical protein